MYNMRVRIKYFAINIKNLSSFRRKNKMNEKTIYQTQKTEKQRVVFPFFFLFLSL
jgi:hypothetical protein